MKTSATAVGVGVGVVLACLLVPTTAGYGGATGDQLVFSPSDDVKGSVMSQTVVVTRPNVSDVGAFPRATAAVNGVAARLHALVDPGGAKNYIVSPVSVAVIVGQLLLAARGETQTRLRALLTPSRAPRRPDNGGDGELHRQLGALLQSLQASAAESTSLQLHSGNGLFHLPDLSLSKQFKADLMGFYRSELTAVDFRGSPSGAQRTINTWVSKQTSGVFDGVLPAPLPPTTAAVLVNTLYFKAAWLTPFDADLTVTAPFHLNTTHLIDVTYMRGQFDVPYVDSDDLRCRLIVLPYKHNDVNMYIILPHRRVDTDIKTFAETLTPSAIATLVNSTEENSVTVVLPRMSLKTKFNLKEPLANFRPEDGVSSRLADDDPVDESTWTTMRKNVTSNQSKTTTSRTPTTKTRRPATTATTSQQPPHTTKQSMKETVGEGEITSRSTKRPASSAFRPTTSKQSTGRPTQRTTTTTTTKKPPVNEFRFDLSGASSDPRFNVEDIVHQISLEVTELGTEAAAVSVVDVNYSGDIRVLKLDRPFVFFVRHEPSLSNLFWAVITDPTNGDYD